MKEPFRPTFWICLVAMALSVVTLNMPLQVEASPTQLEQSGTVTVENGGSSIIDPEKPEDEGDPGEGPSTVGPLRIDYVSSLDFGRVSLTDEQRKFSAFAQQLQGDAGPRGSYLQLTDQRAEGTGWTLQVKQNHQFRHVGTQQSLTGAVLSLDHGWANSSGTSEAPLVTRDTVALNNIGDAYELAQAKSGAGRGVWTITFGASNTNENNLANTMAPAFDRENQRIRDELTGKPAYYNSAIQLAIPKGIPIQPIQYETELTWILATLP